jgi:lipoprotein-releasing system permease protein
MFIILTLIILVAAFNIISSMIMLVRDKESSISILRTIGISENSILRIFIVVGASIGVIGTIIGFIIGLLFTLNIQKIQYLLESITGSDLFAAEIYFLSKLPAKIDFYEVALVVLFALVLSLLATLYPAWRASRIDPIKVLRHA